MTLKVGSLFTGIGGLDLGLVRAGMDIAWQAETNPFCSKVLAKHWPNTRNLGDVTQIDWAQTEPVDVIAGGFPCQDISNAHTHGAREGLAGDKSGLWANFREAITELQPRWAIIENVAAWRRWVPQVRSDLHAIGYASVPLHMSAGHAGAAHRRPRIFVVTHPYDKGEPLRTIYAQMARLCPVPRHRGNWRDPFTGPLRMANGIPGSMDRLRALGNAVVPQVAERIGRMIINAEEVMP